MNRRERNRLPAGRHGARSGAPWSRLPCLPAGRSWSVIAVADHVAHSYLLGRRCAGTTKSEARAALKRCFGPIPSGTILERVA